MERIYWRVCIRVERLKNRALQGSCTVQETRLVKRIEPMRERNEFTKARIEEIAAALENTPAPERPLSKSEALDLLAPSLKASRDRGHTLAGLVEQLAAQGIKTHARAVSESIARAGGPKSARDRKQREKQTAQAIEHPSANHLHA
jgi:hypothetical protein